MIEQVSCCIATLFIVWYRARRASHTCHSTNDDTPPPPSSTTRHALFFPSRHQTCCPFLRDACTSLGACHYHSGFPGSCWTCPSTCGHVRCQVHPTFYVFAVLMLLRVNTEFTEVAHRLCVEVCAGDISCMQHVFVHVAGNLGEAFLLGLAIRHLERAVSFPYFPLLLRINCVPCSRSVCHNSGDNSGDDDGKSDMQATTM